MIQFVINQEEVRNKFGESTLKVITLLAEDTSSTAETLAQKLNLSQRGVQKILAKLTEHQYIERVGSKKSGYWNIKK